MRAHSAASEREADRVEVARGAPALADEAARRGAAGRGAREVLRGGAAGRPALLHRRRVREGRGGGQRVRAGRRGEQVERVVDGLHLPDADGPRAQVLRREVQNAAALLVRLSDHLTFTMWHTLVLSYKCSFSDEHMLLPVIPNENLSYL